MKRILLLGALLLIAAGACTTSPTSRSETASVESVLKEFERQLRKDVQDDGLDGSISAAVIKGDKILWSGAFGNADKNSRTPADTSTIYRTGSISKSFTALLMMELVDEGIINLTDPVEKFLPEIKKLSGYSDSTRITFAQLASHTSGLIREPELDGAASGPIGQWEEKILLSIPKTSFGSPPGRRFNYSNIGYGILGLALSRAAKKPFIDLVKEKIFVPLGMTNSFFIVPDDKKAHLAAGMGGGPFSEIDMDGPRDEHAGRGYKVPNGGIYSTPRDLTRFVMSVMGYHALVKPDDLQLMQTAKLPKGDKYGFGFSLYEDKDISIVEHGGSVAGYTAQIAFERNSKYGVVLMRNYNWGHTDLSLRAYALLRDLKKAEGK